MATLIQKAAGKNRTALTNLYEMNKRRVFSLCHALIRNYQSASVLTTSVMQAALQMVIDKRLLSEEDFARFTIQQAAYECKIEILNQDPMAFSTSPKQDFHIQDLQMERIRKYAGPLENYLNHLPIFQRFVFALRYIGNLSVSDVSCCLDVMLPTINLVLASEQDNLNRIYRAVIAVGGQCTPPTSELLKTAFEERIDSESVPQTADQQILMRTPGWWCRHSAGHGALIPASWCMCSAEDGASPPFSVVHGGWQLWCAAAMLGLSF